MSLSNDPNEPINQVIGALSCLKERDEHLATDLVDIVAGLLRLIPEAEKYAIVHNKPIQPTTEGDGES